MSAVPGELAARWRAAEHQLYPLLLNDPGAYQRGVLAVRALADELGSVRSLAGLEAAYPAYAGPGGRAAVSLGLASPVDASLGDASLGDASLRDASLADLVAGAAFALRHRELASELEASAVAERIASAARAGQDWAVLREVGTPETSAFGAYRRLEMHLRDGTGLHAFAEVGEDGRPVFVVEAIPLDPATGRPRGEATERREASEPAAWEAARAELRAAVTGSGTGAGAALDTVGRAEGG